MATVSMTHRKIAEAATRLFAEKGTAQISVSELAQAAGVARGTVYKSFPTPGDLFEEIASQLADHLHKRLAGSTDGPREPAQCLADGLRHFVKQAHEHPEWARFVVRFGIAHGLLRGLWEGQPAIDLASGLESGRFRFERQQIPSILAMIAGTGLSAMFMVLEGHKTWRDAGADAAEFVLRAVGLDAEEARRIAHSELPPLSGCGTRHSSREE
jgi:AcrR family transcriptional regulator